jgi:hypothetical protein
MSRLAFICLLPFLALTGCATSPEPGATTGPEGCVVVDNSGGSGRQSRIFLVSESSGWRLGMGQVAVGGELEFCTRRIRGAERVYILIEQPAAGERNPSLIWTEAGYIRSPVFTLDLNDVWTWDVDRNQLTRAIRF